MGKVRISSFSVSLDGYGAGPEQTPQEPLGRGGENLHRWFLPTNTFQSMLGSESGTRGVDDEIAAKGVGNLGAWIMGRNMFGPAPSEGEVRGDWDEEWKGWWGDNPPYHGPVFVLTHHARAPLEMDGGTTFYFVTDGIEAALEQARQAAGDKDVLIAGGVETVREYLRARLLDELHVAFSPILLGGGENLFEGLDLPALGYRVTETVATEAATHVFIAREA